jgi:hypothetical protein
MLTRLQFYSIFQNILRVRGPPDSVQEFQALVPLGNTLTHLDFAYPLAFDPIPTIHSYLTVLRSLVLKHYMPDPKEGNLLRSLTSLVHLSLGGYLGSGSQPSMFYPRTLTYLRCSGTDLPVHAMPKLRHLVVDDLTVVSRVDFLHWAPLTRLEIIRGEWHTTLHFGPLNIQHVPRIASGLRHLRLERTFPRIHDLSQFVKHQLCLQNLEVVELVFGKGWYRWVVVVVSVTACLPDYRLSREMHMPPRPDFTYLAQALQPFARLPNLKYVEVSQPPVGMLRRFRRHELATAQPKPGAAATVAIQKQCVNDWMKVGGWVLTWASRTRELTKVLEKHIRTANPYLWEAGVPY